MAVRPPRNEFEKRLDQALAASITINSTTVYPFSFLPFVGLLTFALSMLLTFR